MKFSFMNKLLMDIADEKNIKLEFFSYNYIAKLKKDGKEKYILGSDIGNNSDISLKIANDKCCTYLVLSQHNIPVAEHRFIDASNICDLNFTKKYNYDVVVKPNQGLQGKDVMHVTNYDNLVKEAKRIIKIDKSVTISPFYNIKEEYRTVYLDGECLLTYAKDRLFVIGNSENSVKELIKIQNLEKINLENIDKDVLNYVPKKNEKKYISWKHNLCFGAKPRIITDKCKLSQIHKIVKEATKAIDITFATIDVIELFSSELLVLEINATVGMTKFSEYVANGYNITKDIFSKAIDKLF
ncbi:MAG: hypothetical protein RR144_02080 [Clostridia bacterium]